MSPNFSQLQGPTEVQVLCSREAETKGQSGRCVDGEQGRA